MRVLSPHTPRRTVNIAFPRAIRHKTSGIGMTTAAILLSHTTEIYRASAT